MSDRGVVEAALFVSGGNITAERLAKICNLDLKRVREVADDLVREYTSRDGGVEVTKSGKAYGMRVNPAYEENVTPLIPETDMPKAMLKTLAMIAYEQPVKQSYIVKLRGNRVYDYMKRLQELEFIERKDDGHTKILSTTAKFNKYFRINDSKELVKNTAVADDADQTKLDEPPAPTEENATETKAE
jgi:segregation and condensation protein B